MADLSSEFSKVCEEFEFSDFDKIFGDKYKRNFMIGAAANN